MFTEKPDPLFLKQKMRPQFLSHLPLSLMVCSSTSQFLKKYWTVNLKSFSRLQFPYHRSEYYSYELDEIMSTNVKIHKTFSFSLFVLTKLSVDAFIAKIAWNLVSPVTMYQSLPRGLELVHVN